MQPLFFRQRRGYGRDMVAFVYYRDGRSCCYCGKFLHRHEATVDHYLPTVLGGSDEPENLRLACTPCNNLKGGMHPEAWEALAATQRARVNRQLSRYEQRCSLIQRATPYWKLKYGSGV